MTTQTLPSGDTWIDCDCGGSHWGLYGAAGLLLVRRDSAGKVTHVAIQHRAMWTDQGGTWGIPGGAMDAGEDAVEGALREAREEMGVDTSQVRVLGLSSVDHGNWAYTTVIAEATEVLALNCLDGESIAVGWMTVADLDSIALHSGFESAWDNLRWRINRGDFD